MCDELATESDGYIVIFLLPAFVFISDLDSVVSSDQDGNTDEETFDATELDATDPDVTVNDDNIVIDTQEQFHSNSHDNGHGKIVHV